MHANRRVIRQIRDLAGCVSVGLAFAGIFMVAFFGPTAGRMAWSVMGIAGALLLLILALTLAESMDP